ncbi:MAG: TetR/AcrR family transcriptional regulator [Novosphingobium sp.]
MMSAKACNGHAQGERPPLAGRQTMAPLARRAVPAQTALEDTATPETGRQVRKSAATRARLIEATISCLVKHGYARTVTPLVAAEAGLSRGAMLHHFANGDALIRATIAELHERRLNAFRRASQAHEGDVRAMVRGYWQQLQKPGFIAFQELAMAARTDPGLAAILLPLQDEFAQKFQALAGQLYPEWTGKPGRFDLAMALSQTLMEGMRIASFTGAMDDRLIEPLLDFLEGSVKYLRPDGSSAATTEQA